MAASYLGVLTFLFVFWLECHTHSVACLWEDPPLEVWAGVFSSVFEAATWFKGNDAIILSACTLGSG